ncbi:MAG: hypothetical protein AAGD06_10335 [Acidobacteriota bacterium]
MTSIFKSPLRRHVPPLRCRHSLARLHVSTTLRPAALVLALVFAAILPATPSWSSPAVSPASGAEGDDVFVLHPDILPDPGRYDVVVLDATGGQASTAGVIAAAAGGLVAQIEPVSLPVAGELHVLVGQSLPLGTQLVHRGTRTYSVAAHWFEATCRQPLGPFSTGPGSVDVDSARVVSGELLIDIGPRPCYGMQTVALIRTPPPDPCLPGRLFPDPASGVVPMPLSSFAARATITRLSTAGPADDAELAADLAFILEQVFGPLGVGAVASGTSLQLSTPDGLGGGSADLVWCR